MRVSRLEVFGFKSFMERLVLPLETGITGVVGPNGCGKSNIVDALRWVMGETRAHNLRGGVLEDVIFNGTDALRPLGLAEVSISVQASGGDLFTDLSHGIQCEELLAATIAGDESQDQEVVIEKPIEEAVAEPTESRPKLTVISGALDENKATELVDTQSAPEAAAPPEEDPVLTRYSWLKSISEVQITRRLYRSGESEFFINRTQVRLRDVKELFRVLGLGARGYSIIAQGEVTRIVSAKPEDRRLILEEAAGVLGFRDKIASSKRRLEETSQNLARLDDIIKEVTRQVNSLRVQASRAKNREGLKAEIRALDLLLAADSVARANRSRIAALDLLEKARNEEGSAQALVDTKYAEEANLRAEMMAVDTEADGHRTQMDSLREELSRRASERQRFQSRVQELKAFMLASQTETKRLESLEQTLLERVQDGDAELMELSDKEQTLAQELAPLSDDGSELIRSLTQSLQDTRKELHEREVQHRQLRDKVVSSESSIKALDDQISAASPINQLREKTDERNSEVLQEIALGLKTFAEGITVRSEYAKALQAILGDQAKYIVSSDPEKIAKFFSEKAKKGNVQGGIGVFKEGNTAISSPSSATALNLPKMLDFVEIAPSHAAVATRLLAHVYVAPSIDAAYAALKHEGLTGEEIIVTETGEVISSYKFLAVRTDGGLVQVLRRVQDLKEAAASLESEQSAITAQCEELKSKIKDFEVQLSAAFKERDERQKKARAIGNELGNVKGRLSAAMRMLEQAKADHGRLDGQRRAIAEKVQGYEAELSDAQETLASMNTEEDKEIQAQYDEVKKQYHASESTRKSQRDSLGRASQLLEEARRALDGIRKLLAAAELEEQRASMEAKSVEERISIDYDVETFALVTKEVEAKGEEAIINPDLRSEQGAELVKLRGRIQREGDVDPTSIARFEEEDKRLNELESQRADLSKAANTLETTIERLTKTSEERFIATFNAVKENFTLIIPKLFGGGKGDLTLTNPEKPLESGVEIIARPPGKKLKSIELMSGGEKALCATALIFSMFLVRPSPMCVLDEVDAPLDEANLQRFLGMVREMSTKTQFLMITHNKASMSMADNLIGVTMPQPGASKMISVSLKEAVAAVA